jgi:hypothetical protein
MQRHPTILVCLLLSLPMLWTIHTASALAATTPVAGAVAKPSDFVITPPWAEGIEHKILAGLRNEKQWASYLGNTAMPYSVPLAL